MSKSDNESKQPFTASSLAKQDGVDFSYIARLCRQGKIEALKLGTIWLISYEVGMAWINAREERVTKSKPA